MATYRISGRVIIGISGNVNAPWPVIPNNIVKISDNAFKNCDKIYGELKLPDSLVEIGDSAFEGCKGLYWIKLKEEGSLLSASQLKIIGKRAFYGTSINDRGQTPDTGALYNNKYAANQDRLLESAICLEVIGDEAFAGINNSTFFSNPNRRKVVAYLNPYTFVGRNAFGSTGGGDLMNTKYITGFEIDSSNKIVSLYYSGNDNIDQTFDSERDRYPPMSMPDSITAIGNKKGLLCKIKDTSYTNDQYLNAIESSPEHWRTDTLDDVRVSYAFNIERNIRYFPTIIYKDYSYVTIGKNAVLTNNFTLAMNNIKWNFPPDYTGTRIPGFTFYRCFGLNTINIPVSITTIDRAAFRGCRYLTEIKFDIENSRLTTIEQSAFKTCPLLREIRFPKSLQSYQLAETFLISDPIMKEAVGVFPVIGGKGNGGLLGVGILNDTFQIDFGSFGREYDLNDLCTVYIPKYSQTLNIKITEVNLNGAIVKAEFVGEAPKLTIKLYFFPTTILTYGGTTPANLIAMNTERATANYPLLDVKVYTMPVYNTTNTIVTGNNSGSYIKAYLYNDTLTFKNTVTAINNDAFIDANLLKGTLVLPNSLLTIGSSAFKNCQSLNGNLIIPTNVTSIGASAFENCYSFSQNELVIPPSVLTIGDNAFKGMNQIQVVRISNGANYNYAANAFPSGATIISTFSDGTFEYFDNTKALISGLVNKSRSFPTIPSTVTGIDTDAFKDNAITGNVMLNTQLQNIANNAFRGCTGITQLSIPSNSALLSIGNQAFYGCSNLINNLGLNNCPNLRTIGEEAFRFTKITSLNIVTNSSLTSIGSGAFYNCIDLAGQVTIPQNVTSIGNGAFYKTKISRVSFSQPKITIINKDTFSSCSSLTSFQSASGIFISDSITIVDDRAFKDCINLAGNLAFGLNISSIGISAFENCSKLTGTLIIPSTVTSIGSRAFAGCTGFTKIIYPGGRINVATDAFDGIPIAKLQQNIGFLITGTVITGINPTTGIFPTIPSNITEIADNAFKGCTGLTGSLVIPINITKIGISAFEGCINLKGKLTFSSPSSVTSIEASAFKGCNGFTGALVIPIVVRTIGDNAFNGCNKFSSVTYTASTSISTNTFTGVTNLIVIPIFTYADERTKVLLTGILPRTAKLVFPIIPSTVTDIQSNAFENCTGLTGTVKIPITLVAIGESAFKGCTGITKLELELTPITLRSALIAIGPQAFSGCINLAGTITIPKSVRLLLPATFFNCNKALFRYYSSTTETTLDSFPPGRATDLRAMTILNSDEEFDNVIDLDEVVDNNPPPLVNLNKVSKPSINVKRLNFANGQFLFNVKK
jgi:hypothetical protein